MIRERNGSTFHYCGPWQQCVKVTHVLCSDGKRRTVTMTGEPDTFWSQPGRVSVKGKTVRGFVWFDDFADVWKFTPAGWLKNAAVLPAWSCS